MKKRSILVLTNMAMACALMAVCSWITVPAPIPFTLQTLAVLTTSALFGAKIGVLSVSAYLFLGCIGLPVFSGFQGGIGHLLGASGGYLFGFVFTAAICGALSKTKLPLYFSMTMGILACYTAGTLWYSFVYNSGEAFWHIVSVCVLPYIVPDALKTALSVFIIKRLKRLNLTKY